MDVETVVQDNRLIVKLKGRLAGNVCDEFADSIMPVINADISDVIIDLEGLEYMSSSGLGIIIRLHRDLSDMDKKLLLAAANKNVREILEISNINKLIPMYTSMEEACKQG